MNRVYGGGVPIGRRAFLCSGTLVLTAARLTPSALLAVEHAPATGMHVGLVTDLHYADKPASGSRHYRETLDKLAEAAQRFRAARLSFVVELGDFVDAADSVASELGYLERVNRDFTAICQDRHYVLGNHCVHTLNKAEFLEGVEREASYYSFDRGDYHFVVLDSCFRGDGEPYGRKNFAWTDPNIPASELEWLVADLAATELKTIVFAHQRLDVSNHYGVKNGQQVREAFEESRKVLAVLQGHSHQNDYRDINGIHYCTLAAMVEGSGAESNAYALMTLVPDGTLQVEGFRRQKDYTWSQSGA